jgi:exodeoxyribonuclease V alpha subunit
MRTCIQRFGWTFGAGDKVMQVENDYDKYVYNGDLGFVRSVDAEASEVLVEFDGRGRSPRQKRSQ